MPYCKKCGRELERDTKFCPHCGTRVSVKALRATEEPKARPEAPHKIGKPVIAVIASVAIAVVIIIILAVYVRSERGEGGGAAPPPGQITIWAEAQGNQNVVIWIEHGGGALNDLELRASNSSGEMVTIDGAEWTIVSSGLSSVTYVYGPNPQGKVITVYIIYKPSHQKIFASSSIVVR